MDQNKKDAKKFDPASLYPKPKTYDEIQTQLKDLRDNRQNIQTNGDGIVMTPMRIVLVNLVLNIMFITTMVCCMAVLALGDDGKTLDSIDMINTRAYTIPMFIAIFAGLPALNAIIGTYKLRYIELFLVYLIFAVAAGYSAVFMTQDHWHPVLIYGLLYILSQVYVWSIFETFNHGFNKQKLYPAIGVIVFIALLALFL